MTDDIAQVSARAEALECDIATARRQRDSLRAELAACRAERDRLRLLWESDRTRFDVRIEELSSESQQNVARALAAGRAAEELAGELAAIRKTLSWRVTRPLRMVRRLRRS